MILSTLLSLSLLGRLAHPFGTPQQSMQVYSTAGWLIEVERDRFTGKVRCELQTPRRGPAEIRYAQGALRFQFSPRVNTLDAWYRIDDGPAKRWQDLYPTLVQTGVTLEGANLANPTGGVVALPRIEVGEARVVTIRTSARSQPRRFKVRGLSEALDAAKRQGCSDPSFVR